MKMQLEQRRQAMLQLHLNDQQIYFILRSDYEYTLYTANANEDTIYQISNGTWR